MTLLVVLGALAFLVVVVAVGVRRFRREPPRVAHLESREPREAVQRSMRRGE